MDTDEMYRRGVADAERGEVHPFYYQHYYPYRRAFDSTRRRLHQPAILQTNWRRTIIIIGALLIVGLTGFVLFRRSQEQAALLAQSSAASTVVRAAVVLPTSTPIFPTATPLPTPTPVALHTGGHATVVNIKDGALRARQEPNLKSPVKVSFHDGDNVNVVEGPVEADGYTWWRIESDRGTGWSAQQSQDGVEWLKPVE
ncbi:MAG TPA: hypothetical protein VFT66_24935 [Roseiflexaceae bacterium]|nr:hypothetical protein [Roseiflexaceae bacterium]